jgi:hypothetical protein
LHCENENLIKTDWLTMWVLKDIAPNISLAESGNLTQTGMGSDFQFWLLFSFYRFSVCPVSPSVFLCVFYKLDQIAPVL